MENSQSPEIQPKTPESTNVPEKASDTKKDFDLNPVVSFENNDSSSLAAAKQVIDNSTQDQNTKNIDDNVISDNNIDEKDISWVEEAEKVMEQDKGNPYKEEQDAETLQKKYLKKRFNLSIFKKKE